LRDAGTGHVLVDSNHRRRKHMSASSAFSLIATGILLAFILNATIGTLITLMGVVGMIFGVGGRAFGRRQVVVARQPVRRNMLQEPEL
jgi:hypothetical protein